MYLSKVYDLIFIMITKLAIENTKIETYPQLSIYIHKVFFKINEYRILQSKKMCNLAG